MVASWPRSGHQRVVDLGDTRNLARSRIGVCPLASAGVSERSGEAHIGVDQPIETANARASQPTNEGHAGRYRPPLGIATLAVVSLGWRVVDGFRWFGRCLVLGEPFAKQGVALAGSAAVEQGADG